MEDNDKLTELIARLEAIKTREENKVLCQEINRLQSENDQLKKLKFENDRLQYALGQIKKTTNMLVNELEMV